MTDQRKYWVLEVTIFDEKTRQITEFGETRNRIPVTREAFEITAQEVLSKEKHPYCYLIKQGRKPRS